MKSARIPSYSGPYLPTFGLNTEKYSVSLRIQSECGKIRIRITPNTDTFYFLLFTFPSLIDVPLYLAFPTGIVKYRLGRLSKMEHLCHFHINSFNSSVWIFSIQGGVFFYIPIYWRYYALRVPIIKQTYKRKKQFSRWQRV